MSDRGKGYAFECEIRKLFKAAGYDVIRGAGSQGTVFGFDADLIATKITDQNTKTAYLVIVQCKVKGKKKGRV